LVIKDEIKKGNTRRNQKSQNKSKEIKKGESKTKKIKERQNMTKESEGKNGSVSSESKVQGLSLGRRKLKNKVSY
jgi:hypothetical protein